MYELGVAVIDDVKEIKVLFLALQPLLIIPKPIYQPISIEEIARFRTHARQTAVQRRGQAGGGKGIRMISLQTFDQHLANKIHAGPVLFDEVTKNSQTRRLRWRPPGRVFNDRCLLWRHYDTLRARK